MGSLPFVGRYHHRLERWAVNNDDFPTSLGVMRQKGAMSASAWD